MSHLLDQLRFFKRKQGEFANSHGETRHENRDWENSYRARWSYDKVVRSTHGVNCTGSCSWKIYVKNGLVTWETQQTDYPRTRPDLPNHEPRGCPRGASYSWYMYSTNRLKYPKVRKPLLKLWREAKAKHTDPVLAWASIVENPTKSAEYKSKRGLGGFVRSSWQECAEIIAAANVYTAKTFGPDRIIGFSPIPAMSMLSYASGSRYLSLIGGACLSFYDWYCDLPPASPMVWGEQTDVAESADWYNSDYIIAWGSNVPQTRTPDAHFFTEVRYKGTKTVAITPDYAEIAKLCDLWLNPKQGTDAALAQAFCHVIIKEFYLKSQSDYFQDYAKRYTDLPMLVVLEEKDDKFKAGRFLRASDLIDNLGQENNPEWKTIAMNQNGELVSPYGSIGYRWGETGRWNLENKEGQHNGDVDLTLSLKGSSETASVGLDYFGGDEHPYFTAAAGDAIQYKNIPCHTISLANGQTAKVATVFDLMVANLGVDNGHGGQNVTDDYNDANIAGTPAWQEKITGVSREKVIQIAREFAENAHKTQGKSMVIIGAGMNHWYHLDMNYRGVINMLMLCGCIGKSGGGWAHYVGQEKLRPQSGWAPVAFGLDWHRPPRHMNSTSFFYNHSSQWRHETVSAHELLSSHANKSQFPEHMLDYNIKAERAGWLPSAPQLNQNPLTIAPQAKAKGMSVQDYVVESLHNGSLRFAAEQPDNPQNFPRNMFIWRSNLLGSSGKGHEYMLKYLLGAKNGLLGDETVQTGFKPNEIDFVENAPTGKIDLVTTLDFRMSSTCLYSDIVLPTATWYEKEDINTSDMHPFIHPFTAATDPAWEAKTDWEIYKYIAKAFSRLCVGHLGTQTDVVTLPMQHDSADELAQPFGGTDWKSAGEKPIPGINCPLIKVVERDYPSTYAKFTSLGPLMDKLGNNSKGIDWDTKEEVQQLGQLNYRIHDDSVANTRPNMSSVVNAIETVLMLAPETNGHVAVKAWAELSKKTGRDHTHLAKASEHEKIRFNDIVAQPRKIISSPTWSGLESDKVSYNAGYTNVHELIPWRTITGRQQFYVEHPWIQAFGEQMQQYRPPIDTKTTQVFKKYQSNGNKEIVLNFLTPHQKWGIHSTYSENLLMLTLSRGGPIVWISEIDAQKAGIEDNDWIEVFNANGAITARAVVSQRVKEGMTMMYHAQEKLVNIPGSENSGTRGGIHNSVTRTILKPTHMIGGYAQFSYGFNYYGTVGCNRDEFVVVRKMANIDWLEGKADDELPRPLPTTLD